MSDKMKDIRKDKFVGDADEGKTVLEAMRRAAQPDSEESDRKPDSEEKQPES